MKRKNNDQINAALYIFHELVKKKEISNGKKLNHGKICEIFMTIVHAANAVVNFVKEHKFY